jgi:mxaJ protein
MMGRVLLIFAAAAAVVFFVVTVEPDAISEASGRQPRVLRVCADPNNLPFSNRKLEGFENRLAELVAGELHADLEYYWWAQHRGFIRNTLGAGKCDVIPGIASSMERVLTTAPYYRSAYVFVTRSDRRLAIGSFDSPILKQLRIGVHLVGDDGSNTPPLHALERRNIGTNVAGFSLTGDYSRENPPARLVEAVAHKEVDVAIAWGPLAGYFARKRGLALDVKPVSPIVDPPSLPMAYDISMGVRQDEEGLKKELDGILQRRRFDIEQILDSYGIPRLNAEGRLIASRAP